MPIVANNNIVVIDNENNHTLTMYYIVRGAVCSNIELPTIFVNQLHYIYTDSDIYISTVIFINRHARI